MWDESPFDLRRPHIQPNVQKAATSSTALLPLSTAIAIKHRLNAQIQDKAVTNIFASFSGFTWLMFQKRRDTNVPIFIDGNVVDQLQRMKNNSAVCLRRCLEVVDSCTLAENIFSNKTRIPSRDRLAANGLAQAQFMAKREHNWDEFDVTCEARMVADVHNKASAPFEFAIKGMIHFALATSGAGHTYEFQKSCAKVIRPRLRLLDGFPSDEDELTKHIAVRTFLSSAKSQTERRLLIMMLPTVDIEATGPIEIRVPFLDSIDDQEHYLDELSESMAAALVSRGLRMWNRSKWNTWAEATCDIGLGLTYNNIYRDAFAPYCETLGKKLSASSARTSFAEALDDANANDDADQDDNVEDAPEGAAVEIDAPAENQKYAKAMSHADKANEFLQHVVPSARASCIALRNVLSSLQRFLGKQAYYTSTEYEKHQQARAAKICQTFSGDEHFGKPTREYAVQVMARGTMEEHAMSRLRALLFDSRLWRLVPKADMTNRFKAMVNISTNKAGSGMEKHFNFRHARPPFDNFLLIDQPELAESIRGRRWCLKDLWTRNFHGKNEDLTSIRTRARLICHARRITPNIIPKECHNAHIRKVVQSRIQTRSFDAPQLAAQLCGQFFRSEYLKSDSFMTRYGDLKGDNVTEEPAPLDGKATDGEHEAGSSGGPYRAFLRYKRLKSNTEPSRLYRQFQRDQPDEFAELQRHGARGDGAITKR